MASKKFTELCNLVIGQKLASIEIEHAAEVVILTFENMFIELQGDDLEFHVQPIEPKG
jgi:hypothetical protein